MASKQEFISKDQNVFLEILRSIIHKDKYTETDEEILLYLKEVLRLSSIHMIYPLVVDALYNIYPKRMEEYKNRAINQTVNQASRTASFLLLYQRMQEEGLSPIVMKGIVCRNLYEQPETRLSVDEDLLINPEEIYKYHKFLLKQGFHLTDEDITIDTADEISYQNKDNHLYLEVHKHPFAPDDDIFSDLNEMFVNREEPVTIPIYGVDIKTLDYTGHLLYMVCHAYKHLIYSGIGIRQLCDMTLFAETYGKHIDWERIVTSLKKYNLILLGEALLKICVDHLGMDTEKAGCSNLYALCEVDVKPLLADILSGGIYGAQDENRLHSANMTLSAVSAKKQGKKNSGLKQSLFPSYEYIANNYPYLKNNRLLLPFAWIQRILTYLKNPNKTIKPGKSLEIGKQRIELLKKYKII